MRSFKIAFKSALTCGVFVILQGSIYSCKKTVSNRAAETKVVNKIATIATSTSTVTINYTSQLNGNGSPLLFGGSNEPSQAHYASVYPQLQNAGIKFQRGTLHVDRLFATNFANITLADYQNNVNNVQDPNTWDWSALTWADNAKAQGFTTMANIFSAPGWLTYDGNVSGVPKSWTVWQDIIGKVIQKYAAKLDYIEILNEPLAGSFLTLGGSSYSTKQAAAKDIYYYAATGIRAVNTTITVGGDGDSEQGGDFGALGTILRDTRLSSNMIQFVSYHIYNPNPPGADQYSAMLTLLNNSGHASLPIFITEYNHNYDAGTTDPHVIGNTAVTFMGNTLLGFMIQPQIKGAAIYAFLPNNAVLDPQEDCVGCTNIAQGFYNWNGTSGTLVNQSRAIRLLSTSMKLGAGAFRTYSSSNPGISYGLGAINSNGNVIALLNNESATANTVNLVMNNTGGAGNHTVMIYVADTGSNDGGTAVATLTNQLITSGTMTISNLNLPANALVGVIIL